MQIFGLDPAVGALLIAGIGVLYSVGLGYAKNSEAFNGRKLVTSILIAVPGAIILVATGIRNSTPGDDLDILLLIVGWVMQISGTDNTVKGIASLIGKSRQKPI